MYTVELSELSLYDNTKTAFGIIYTEHIMEDSMIVDAISEMLQELEVNSEIRSKIIIEAKNFESRLDRLEKMLEGLMEMVDKHSALLIGKQSNGDFDFGLVYKYEEMRKKLNWILAGVWVIATAMLAALAKIIFFGGI